MNKIEQEILNNINNYLKELQDNKCNCEDYS